MQAECPECGSQILMTAYDHPPSRLEHVRPGYVFTCTQCSLRHDAWSYVRPFSAEKAIRHWNHHASIWPGEAARQRRKLIEIYKLAAATAELRKDARHS